MHKKLMNKKLSRRDLSFLLPALAAASASAQGQAPLETMTCKAYPSDKLPYSGNETKKGRRFFFAQTHGNFKIEMHETILAPDTETHPPHQHEHEEIIIVTEGTVEANMDGKRYTVPPRFGAGIRFKPHAQREKRRNDKLPLLRSGVAGE